MSLNLLKILYDSCITYSSCIIHDPETKLQTLSSTEVACSMRCAFSPSLGDRYIVPWQSRSMAGNGLMRVFFECLIRWPESSLWSAQLSTHRFKLTYTITARSMAPETSPLVPQNVGVMKSPKSFRKAIPPAKRPTAESILMFAALCSGSVVSICHIVCSMLFSCAGEVLYTFSDFSAGCGRARSSDVVHLPDKMYAYHVERLLQ